MSDVVVVAASVVPGANAVTGYGTAGETITQGQPVYLKASDQKLWKADNNLSAAVATVKGIALNCASAGQPVKYQYGGLITIGATLVGGTIYVLSDTVGGIMPAADLDVGSYVSIIGVASTTAVLALSIINTGFQVPAP